MKSDFEQPGDEDVLRKVAGDLKSSGVNVGEGEVRRKMDELLAMARGQIAAGSIATRLGLAEGTPLPRSIIEFYYKDDKLGDPMVSEEHITAFNWAATQEIDDMMATALRVNDYMSGLFSAVGITLVDFKVEFGRIYEGDFSRVILADEISPDSCRLWDSTTNEKMDKDRFRRDLGNVIESYTEVARGLGIMKEMPTVIQGGVH